MAASLGSPLALPPSTQNINTVWEGDETQSTVDTFDQVHDLHDIDDECELVLLHEIYEGLTIRITLAEVEDEEGFTTDEDKDEGRLSPEQDGAGSVILDLGSLATCLDGQLPIGLLPEEMQTLLELRHGGAATRAAAAAVAADSATRKEEQEAALVEALGGDAAIGLRPEEMELLHQLRRAEGFLPAEEETRSFGELLELWSRSGADLLQRADFEDHEAAAPLTSPDRRSQANVEQADDPLDEATAAEVATEDLLDEVSAAEVQQLWLSREMELLNLTRNGVTSHSRVVLPRRRWRQRKWRMLKVVQVQVLHRWRRTPRLSA